MFFPPCFEFLDLLNLWESEASLISFGALARRDESGVILGALGLLIVAVCARIWVRSRIRDPPELLTRCRLCSCHVVSFQSVSSIGMLQDNNHGGLTVSMWILPLAPDAVRLSFEDNPMLASLASRWSFLAS
ncbi:hypothetical protein IGI04_014476 [Brassica rapa subsp. trilocularis]|uniref:Uncharacterized protein n=1 Tax=Brassica rapa subsp. trilocularis TaxID=1813537 RepID=A0ABQ7MQS8_BRACM|nr:hypothetical protein IGI04_014476 [Brassica rapa subsp. trilocularis]